MVEHPNGGFEELEEELAQHELNRSKLTAKIRSLCEDGGMTNFSDEKKGILRRAAQVALDTPLLALSWGQVEEHLQSHDGSTEAASPKAEAAVKKIWSQENSLRESVIRHGLPPCLAEKLESTGLKEIGELKLTQVKALTKESNMSNSDKSKIRHLWQQESSEGKSEHQLRMQAIEDQRKNADEAMELAREMKSAI
ncbi:hypothetical protein R1sor_011449 [Riccia sorocarpa]|uniref:Uncharacterized protein n=1 Tax=Riccia sorocarpa TaxID=122646 RepID=A0ABD3I1A3_9MARC